MFSDVAATKASKAFLTKDLCGQSFLCYLIKAKNLLHLLKLKKNKNDNSSVVFSEKTFISAKDGCELKVINVVVDDNH